MPWGRGKVVRGRKTSFSDLSGGEKGEAWLMLPRDTLCGGGTL